VLDERTVGRAEIEFALGTNRKMKMNKLIEVVNKNKLIESISCENVWQCFSDALKRFEKDLILSGGNKKAYTAWVQTTLRFLNYIEDNVFEGSEPMRRIELMNILMGNKSSTHKVFADLQDRKIFDACNEKLRLAEATIQYIVNKNYDGGSRGKTLQ
jgi:hypothetical protein